ncbi:hydrogenase maturation nickel metallochaperone HypA [Sulfurimonas sp. HSL3-7]|uniref:hydrogenase maturation nickel metallochaperone HypA n=1 Tax=Sulfonitrofixus jiaomeiensis TaxID=3131938 RepID=UPI0031F74926
MHEYSVVQALMEQVERLAVEHSAQKVTKVIVKIGVMSGVEPHLLEIAFNTFKEKSICDAAEFVMNIQPLAIVCRACHVRSELNAVHYCCPACGSIDVEVVDGEDMFLMSLEME